MLYRQKQIQGFQGRGALSNSPLNQKKKKKLDKIGPSITQHHIISYITLKNQDINLCFDNFFQLA